MMKKTAFRICLIILFVFLTAGIQCVVADNSSPTVVINGIPVGFDVPPVIESGRTLIPVRAVSEKLEYDVFWDDVNKRVEIIK